MLLSANGRCRQWRRAALPKRAAEQDPLEKRMEIYKDMRAVQSGVIQSIGWQTRKQG